MKKITLYLSALILLSFTIQQFSETNLIGKWKIIKIKNNVGSEIGASAFYGQTFTYKNDHTIVHFNPENSLYKEQTGKWELVENIIYHYDDEQEKNQFGKIIKLNHTEFVVEQTKDKIVTTIFYKRIK
ncbi:lipocalin family protein [Flavobacterium pectinovorum]|uniref:lipocalin family protein n=1 Tax=Flavobacterium pectinovorum TaxID=29533 RepID=UPI001FAC8347|nr:lipocalin family protein [Flavobacterium pectinovorum]MCI9844556.1 lipocalin family protein [Flavobacterium pectinovorum]